MLENKFQKKCMPISGGVIAKYFQTSSHTVKIFSSIWPYHLGIFKHLAIPSRNFQTSSRIVKIFSSVWPYRLEIFKLFLQNTKKFSSKTALGRRQNKTRKMCMPICHATSGGVTPPNGGYCHCVMPPERGYTMGGWFPQR